MSTKLNLCNLDDLPALVPLVRAFHQEMNIPSDETHVTRAITPLLDGSPFGAIYLIGPRRAPLGYIAITFGWSIEYGGMDGFIDEIYIRPPVRRRGLALEALNAVGVMMQSAGITAVHLEVDTDDIATQRLYARAQYRARDRYQLMTHRL